MVVVDLGVEYLFLYLADTLTDFLQVGSVPHESNQLFAR